MQCLGSPGVHALAHHLLEDCLSGKGLASKAMAGVIPASVRIVHPPRKAGRGMAGRGLAEPGVAGRGKARQGTTWRVA